MGGREAVLLSVVQPKLDDNFGVDVRVIAVIGLYTRVAVGSE